MLNYPACTGLKVQWHIYKWMQENLDKRTLKPVSSLTRNVAKLDMICCKKENNKDADLSGCMGRLVCAFVVRKPRRPVFMRRVQEAQLENSE